MTGISLNNFSTPFTDDLFMIFDINAVLLWYLSWLEPWPKNGEPGEHIAKRNTRAVTKAYA